MVQYRSKGGKPPSITQLRYDAFKFALAWIALLVAGAIGYFWVYPHFLSQDKGCARNWPDLSIFTTGNHVTDQRIFWAIHADESDELTQSQDLILQIWENKSTQNITGEAKELWDKAIQAVPDDAPLPVIPVLSLTQEGAIIPYTPVPEVQGESWMWVEGTAGNEATLAYVGSEGKNQAVPVISIKEGPDIPAITSVEKSAVVAEEKPLCSPR